MEYEKKFVISYSGGKDSALALYRAMQMGMTPLALLTTYNTAQGRSWFHGVPETVLVDIAAALHLPLRLIRTSGEEYTARFEQFLREEKAKGADYCVFGDIDIEEHRAWCNELCDRAGLEAFFPLWGESRQKLVYECIDAGFVAHINILDSSRMNEVYLGQKLTREIVAQFAGEGVDICGENGEYHTFVSDGPIFRRNVAFRFGEKILREQRVILPIEVE